MQSDREATTRTILERHRARLVDRAERLDHMLATSGEYLDRGIPVPAPHGCRVVHVTISTRDLDESVRFYTDVFQLGFEAGFSSFEMGAYATDSFFLLTVENWPEGAKPATFGLLVDDVDARHRLSSTARPRWTRRPTSPGSRAARWSTTPAGTGSSSRRFEASAPVA